jgi:hypothetical protein
LTFLPRALSGTCRMVRHFRFGQINVTGIDGRSFLCMNPVCWSPVASGLNRIHIRKNGAEDGRTVPATCRTAAGSENKAAA